MVRLACDGRCGVGKGGSPGQRTVAWRVETRRAGYNRRVDPATLQQLREQSGLRLDKEGRFWHRGGLVEHARTAAVLHQGVHRAPDGRWAARVGRGGPGAAPRPPGARGGAGAGRKGGKRAAKVGGGGPPQLEPESTVL